MSSDNQKLQELGRYRIRDTLGRGSMGIVYRAHDPTLDREVALKTVILPDTLSESERRSFLDRFLLEARVAGKLVHPNIVVTYDAQVDESKGIPFIAMELVDGETLAAVLEREASLNWRRAVGIGISLAGGLALAHQEGIVHRDVKPANVLMSPRGIPKLADFGIAKVVNAEITQEGLILGTPHYMSPEQVGGTDVDGRSDLFSLGGLIYKLVSGGAPFQGADLTTIYQKVLFKHARPLIDCVDHVPKGLDGVLAKAMAKDRAYRFSTAEEMAESLLGLLVEAGEVPSDVLTPPALKPSPPGSAITDRAGVTDALTEIERERPPERREPLEAPAGQASAIDGPRFGASEAEIDRVSRGGSAWTRWAVAGLVVTGALYLSDRLPGVRDFLQGRARSLTDTVESRRAESRERQRLQQEARRLMQQAIEARPLGHWESAQALMSQSLSRFQQAVDGVGEAECLLERGRLFADMGRWTRARADLDAAWSVAKIYDAPRLGGFAVLEAARLEADQGHVSEAETLWSSATQLATRKGDATTSSSGRMFDEELPYTRAYIDLMSSPEPSRYEPLARAARSGSPLRRVEAYGLLAQAAAFHGELVRAEQYLDAAAVGISEERFAAAVAANRVQHASLRMSQQWLAPADTKKATELLDAAEGVFRALDHRPGLASVLTARIPLLADEEATSSLIDELAELRRALGLGELEATDAEVDFALGLTTARAELRTRRLRQTLQGG